MTIRNKGWAKMLFRASIVGLIVLACGIVLSNVRREVRGTESISRMKAIGVAMLAYYEKYERLPPATVIDTKTKNRHSWRVALLEFLDQELFEVYQFDKPWDSAENKKIEIEGSRFYCVSGPKLTANYYVITGEKTLFYDHGKLQKKGHLSDVNKSSIMFVESTTIKAHWMSPQDIEYENLNKRVNDNRGPSISCDYSNAPHICSIDAKIIRLHPSEINAADIDRMLLISKK